MTDSLARQLESALRRLSGRRDGRVVHGRGLVAEGVFTAAPVAARLSRAPHFQGRAIPTLVRFSGASPWRWWPDWLPDVHGLAVSFSPGTPQRSDLLALSLPRFPVRTPDAFLALLRALRPRPALAWRLPFFLLRHPEALRSLPANLRVLARAPASHVGLAYHAIHAFTWVTPYGSERHVRYHWLPEQALSLCWWRALLRGARYLDDDLRARLLRGGARLHLQVELARRGDALDDPSRPWPPGRDCVTVGTLELLRLREDADSMAFDPLCLGEGILPGPDPVLRARGLLYPLAAAGRRGEDEAGDVKADDKGGPLSGDEGGACGGGNTSRGEESV